MKTFLGILMSIVMLLSGLSATGCQKPVPPSEPEIQQQETPPAAEQPADNTLASPADYFPLTKGSTWYYEGMGNEYASFSREVIFTGENKAQVREDNGGTVIAKIFEVDGNAVKLIFFSGESYDNTNLLNRVPNKNNSILKAPLAVGNLWRDSGEDQREITDINASLDTPAGKFENCIKVKVGNPNSTSLIFEYYAKGVGMVKSEFISGDFKVTSTLKKYSIAK